MTTSHHLLLLFCFASYILPTCTFLTSLVSTYVLASFPKTPVAKGYTFLHTPELWEKGVCLSLGIPMFKIYNVSSVISYGKERVVQLHTNHKIITLVASNNDVLYIKTTENENDNKGILIKLQHNNTDMGFSIFMQLLGYDEQKFPPQWKKCMKLWIERVMFSLYDEKYPVLYNHAKLEMWRKGLKSSF